MTRTFTRRPPGASFTQGAVVGRRVSTACSRSGESFARATVTLSSWPTPCAAARPAARKAKAAAALRMPRVRKARKVRIGVWLIVFSAVL